MVTRFLHQAPYWTAMRCRILFWQMVDDRVVLDAIMSGDQPPGADWDTLRGTPFTIVVAVPSRQWLDVAREVLDRWVEVGTEIELRRTRAWEQGSQVLVWEPEGSLLVTLAA